jgi:hypothetical protein
VFTDFSQVLVEDDPHVPPRRISCHVGLGNGPASSHMARPTDERAPVISC